MKIFLLLALAITITFSASSQVLKRLGDRAKQKLEQKAGDKVDKTIDDATDGKTKTETDEGEVKEKTEDGETKIKTEAKNPETLRAYSKYDFVQGEKVIAFEDFSRTEIGDFPTNWNTNGTGEVVTLNKKEGKWLKIDKEGYFLPEFITNIPENSTLEFDLAINEDFSWYNETLVIHLVSLVDREQFGDYRGWYERHSIKIDVHPNRDAILKSGKLWLRAEKLGNAVLSNEIPLKKWDIISNNFAHFSLWRQNQRLRLYVNGEKVLDLPKAFDAATKYNGVIFHAQGFHQEKQDYYLLGNIRLAVGPPDTRNKLITEGKFVTTGIGFDVNSDKLKPTSYGVLKEIANALKENPDVRVKIVGHTDSDGDDAKNLDLSKRRAASVRIALSTEFGIDGSRFETDGMGETKPVADNKTAEGKAQNRRVEFLKL